MLHNNSFINKITDLIIDTQTSYLICYKCYGLLEMTYDEKDNPNGVYFNCKKCLNKINHIKYNSFYKEINILC